MSYTPTTIVGQRWIEALAPWITDDLARYCDAIGSMFQQVAELLEETGTDGEPGYIPPWGVLFDPDLCPDPYLPYLAQFVGVEIPITAASEEARRLIKEEQGFKRGTVGAIEVAIRNSIGTPASYALNPSFAHDGNGSSTAAGWTTAATFFTNTGGTIYVHDIPGYPQASHIFGLESYLELTTAGTLVNEGIATGNVIPCTAGVPITIFFSVYEEIAGNKLQALLGSAEVGQASISFTQTKEGWKRRSVTLTPTASGFARFAVRADAPATNLKILITAVSPREEYFDGDTPGYKWLGTPGDSVTLRMGEGEFALVERRSVANEEDPYHFLILIYNAEALPSEAVLIANLNAVKPGGVFYTIIIGELSYAILEAAHATYTLLEGAHTTYIDMEANPTA